MESPGPIASPPKTVEDLDEYRQALNQKELLEGEIRKNQVQTRGPASYRHVLNDWEQATQPQTHLE